MMIDHYDDDDDVWWKFLLQMVIHLVVDLEVHHTLEVALAERWLESFP